MLEKQSPSPQCQDFRSSWKAFEHAQNLTKKEAGLTRLGSKRPVAYILSSTWSSVGVAQDWSWKAASAKL